MEYQAAPTLYLYGDFQMRSFFATTIFVGSLIGLSACSDMTAPTSPKFVVETNLTTDSASTPVGGTWLIGLEATALGDVADLSSRFEHKVNDPKIGTIIEGDSQRQITGFSSLTGEVNQVTFRQLLTVRTTAIGKFEMTVWPSADPSKKKRFVMVVTKPN